MVKNRRYTIVVKFSTFRPAERNQEEEDEEEEYTSAGSVSLILLAETRNRHT